MVVFGWARAALNSGCFRPLPAANMAAPVLGFGSLIGLVRAYVGATAVEPNVVTQSELETSFKGLTDCSLDRLMG